MALHWGARNRGTSNERGCNRELLLHILLADAASRARINLQATKGMS
jgi:hypothetical protein